MLLLSKCITTWIIISSLSYLGNKSDDKVIINMPYIIFEDLMSVVAFSNQIICALLSEYDKNTSTRL